jgi:hypothetical protein
MVLSEIMRQYKSKVESEIFYAHSGAKIKIVNRA